MKKAGILTFCFSDNPGSALQACALQQIIMKCGVDCDIINYQKKDWKYVSALKKRFSLFWWIPYCVMLPFVKYSYRKYDAFRRDKLNIVPAKAISDASKMKRIANNYDKFVVGSDQVWNFNNPQVDFTHFLDFTDDCNKKVSYSASFGSNEVMHKYRERAAELLKQFKFISVRESQGVDIVKKLTGKNAELVLDPTLLIGREYWVKNAVVPAQKDYILLYFMQPSDSSVEFAKKLSEKLDNAEIIELTSVMKPKGKKARKRIYSPGPFEWVGYFMNAKYVITNSFHGCCFSILFNKEFLAVPQIKKVDTNSRIYSLLEQFGLSNRLLLENLDYENLEKINYEKINTELISKQTASMKYLNKALEISNEQYSAENAGGGKEILL